MLAVAFELVWEDVTILQAHYTVEAGDLRVIRPLVFARERDTRAYAVARKLPVSTVQCDSYCPHLLECVL